MLSLASASERQAPEGRLGPLSGASACRAGPVRRSPLGEAPPARYSRGSSPSGVFTCAHPSILSWRSSWPWRRPRRRGEFEIAPFGRWQLAPALALRAEVADYV